MVMVAWKTLQAAGRIPTLCLLPCHSQASFPVAQTLHFACLLRWCDLIQHLAGPSAAAVFPKKLVLTKPRFQEPAPLPPPPPKV